MSKAHLSYVKPSKVAGFVRSTDILGAARVRIVRPVAQRVLRGFTEDAAQMSGDWSRVGRYIRASIRRHAE